MIRTAGTEASPTNARPTALHTDIIFIFLLKADC